MNGLVAVNIELSSKCNKNCWICGRRKIEKENPEIKNSWGFMDFSLIEKIANQMPSNIICSFHNNGESLMHPCFGDAVGLFKNQIKTVVTNGKLLVKKHSEIINNLDSIAISVFENDPEADEQFEIVKEFLFLKGDRKPFVVIRQNGDVDVEKYKSLDSKVIIAKRLLHSPMGSFNYQKRDPTITEFGICLDFLSHLAIDRFGNVSFCVRFDPDKSAIVGNVNTQTLEEIWNSPKRLKYLEYHKTNQRNKIKLCSKCEFYGVASK